MEPSLAGESNAHPTIPLSSRATTARPAAPPAWAGSVGGVAARGAGDARRPRPPVRAPTRAQPGPDRSGRRGRRRPVCTSTSANVTRYREPVAKPRTPKGRARLTWSASPGATRARPPSCARWITRTRSSCWRPPSCRRSAPTRGSTWSRPCSSRASVTRLRWPRRTPRTSRRSFGRPASSGPRRRASSAWPRAVADRFGGEVPSALEDLVTLPGVGRKTGNVVRSVAFGLPGLPVDTHVLRVTQRLGSARGPGPGRAAGRGEGRAPAERLDPGRRTGRVQPAGDPARARHVCCPKTPLCRMPFGRFLPVGTVIGVRWAFRPLFRQFGFPQVKSENPGATIGPGTGSRHLVPKES